MVVNKKAQSTVYLSIVMAVMIFAFGMLFMNFIKDVVTESRTNLECSTNSSITDGTKLTCLITDSVVPYLFIIILSGAGGLIIARFVL